jgi:hypothetical protein
LSRHRRPAYRKTSPGTVAAASEGQFGPGLCRPLPVIRDG